MFKHVDGGVHAEVIDFPGVISSGKSLRQARQMLASALFDMAETSLLRRKALPVPNPLATDPESDLEEPIHLIITAASRVKVVTEAKAAS